MKKVKVFNAFEIPQDIKNIVTELTKVRMMVEGEYHKNQKVINSIPEVDRNIVQYKIIIN